MASLKVKEIFCLMYSGLLFISGLILVGFSAYLLFKLFYHYAFIPSGSVGPFFVIFVLGIIHLFLTWLGIKGPTREHNFHIVLFMIFTLVLLACEFIVGVWTIVLWDEIEIGSIDLMTKSFDDLISLNYYKKDWNKLQSKLHCCGLDGMGDYNKTQNIPTSCFLDLHKVNASNVVFTEGCKIPLIKYAKRIMIDGIIIGFTCVIFQAVGFFAFYTYFKTLREERSERIARRTAMQREMSTASPGQIQPQVYVPVGVVPPSTSAPVTGQPASGSTGDTDKPPATPPVSTSS